MPKVIKIKDPSVLKNYNTFFYIILFCWFLGGAIYLYDQFKDQKLIIKTHDNIDLFATTELDYHSKIGEISPNDHIRVLRVLFINNHYVINVYVSNQQKGWILKTDNIDLK